ncbi:MAG: hypothetical protein K9I74_07340, partial [Bacteroidales bacterium]|nr:hypothetical protein [Bacteroidales bacterium]
PPKNKELKIRKTFFKIYFYYSILYGEKIIIWLFAKSCQIIPFWTASGGGIRRSEENHLAEIAPARKKDCDGFLQEL